MNALALTIKTEPLPNSRMAVEINLPIEKCKASYEAALSRLSNSVKLPGFRKGKVPKSVLLQHLGTVQIKAHALEKLLDSAWKEAIKEKSIEPLCEPELQGGFEDLVQRFNPSESLTFTLETDVEPSPKLKASKGLKVEAETISFDPSKVDELIEDSRIQLATLVPIENKAAKIGNVAVISFEGKYKDNNQLIEGGSSDSMDVDLEKGKMIPGFIEGIIGMKVNEEKIIECEFPKDYPQEDSRERKAEFTIKLKELKKRELPELDDAFAKQAGDKSNMEELREDLTKRLKADAERRNKSNREEALVEALVQELEVSLPKTLIDQEVRAIVEQTASSFAQQGMDVKSMFTKDLVQSLMESSREDAEKNLRKKLALSALASSEGITVDDDLLDKKCKEVEKELADEKNIDPKRLKAAVSEDLLHEKLFEWLEVNNAIAEKAPEKNLKKTKPKGKAKKSTSESNQSEN